MSVYTTVSRAELTRFLSRYAVGSLLDFAGISAGIENTNYFVTTSAGRFVLTLFEEIPATELPFFLELMAVLAEHGVPSAHPVPDRAGTYLQCLCGKPAALVQRLSGRSTAAPDLAHCAAIGDALGRMHLVTTGLPARRENDRGGAWHAHTAARVAPRLDLPERALLQREISLQATDPYGGLPAGVIHADLFRDNVLFEDHRVTGLIDFYYAYNGPLVYDLGVTVADWCFVPAGRFELDKAAALIGAYHRQRALVTAERAAFVTALRAAGLRFWLSRLKDQHFPKEGELTHIKDPSPFRELILRAIADAAALEAVLP